MPSPDFSQTLSKDRHFLRSAFKNPNKYGGLAKVEEKYKKLIRKQSHINNRLKKLEKIIARTYENRNNSCLHWLSRRLIELCVSNGIGKIVIGYNKEWKQDINLGKRTETIGRS